MLLDHGALHGECMTITGRTMAEELSDVPSEPPSNQEVIRPWSNPMYKTGHLKVLKGNLAPEGCVAKISGIKEPRFKGPARVFNSEHDAIKAILGRKIKAGDVIVIRYEGPKGGPGMPESFGGSPTTPRFARTSARPNAPPRRGLPSGSGPIRMSSSIQTRSSIARSSASTNTSGSC